MQERIAACTAKAVTALGFWEGPVHAELQVNIEGQWILEIAPRSIGSLCSRTLREAHRRLTFVIRIRTYGHT